MGVVAIKYMRADAVEKGCVQSVDEQLESLFLNLRGRSYSTHVELYLLKHYTFRATDV
jgi:hypothetical protein